MRSEKQINAQRDARIWKGMIAGLVGGLVASWTMNQSQALWARLTEEMHRPDSDAQDSSQEDNRDQQGTDEEQMDATVKAASAISEGVFDHKLTKSEKRVAGPIVHYSFGTAVGGLYGAVAELAPEISAGAGLPFGAAFWLVADETAVPLLGFAKGPSEYPLSTHAYALASHFVYGLTTEFVRRTVRNVL